LEYRRFVEFCDACRQYRYIGLCFGPPGVGKTLSASRYSRNDAIGAYDSAIKETPLIAPIDTVLYTPLVMNSPSRVDSDIKRARETLAGMVRWSLRREAQATLKTLRDRDEAFRSQNLDLPVKARTDVASLKPSYMEVFADYAAREKALADPTTLIVVDEADRLRMNSLEQLRAIFDEGAAGLVLIGMPGIEQRVARFAQLYSRIGFVHEFRPLGETEIEKLLDDHWTPRGVRLPSEPMTPEVKAAIIRMTAGNFRLLKRLLAQIERVLDANNIDTITAEAVLLARESLVIGQA
jgi:DNA transposition AAA+ family ATPase